MGRGTSSGMLEAGETTRVPGMAGHEPPAETRHHNARTVLHLLS